MSEPIRAALIGLDSSHTVEFARRLHAPDCPPDQKVTGMRVVSCLRFATPFQDEAGLDQRQAQLQEWGVPVTTDFQEAVADCDALMLEINDPTLHREYFTRAAAWGKPIFLDKPVADTIESARALAQVGREQGARWFSCSSLRFVPQLLQAAEACPEPRWGHVYGPLGQAAAGSSVVWYGVHAFEMLQRAMGLGASSVAAHRDPSGVVAVVEYEDGRRGVVELTEGSWLYGGCLRDGQGAHPFVVNAARLYTDLLEQVIAFFRGGPAPVGEEDALQVMALLSATERSLETGAPAPLD